MNRDWEIIGVVMVLLAGVITALMTFGINLESDPGGAVQVVSVLVDSAFVPNSIELRRQQPARLVFYRERETPCNEYVVLPDLHKELRLPVHEEVTLELAASDAEEYGFTCGFGLMQGKIRFVD